MRIVFIIGAIFLAGCSAKPTAGIKTHSVPAEKVVQKILPSDARFR
jgi:uncharacterized lipoprotein YajG